MNEEKNNSGGGTGGGPLASGDRGNVVEGGYFVWANQIDFLSVPPDPPAIPGKSVIGLLAVSDTMEDGEVTIGADKGVRITAGPPELPPAGPLSATGVEVVVGELQSITLQRGLIDDVDQKVQITPEGITIDAGAMPITLKSLTEITLSVADGLSTIKLSPEGVSIQGVPMVQIQGGPLVMIN